MQLLWYRFLLNILKWIPPVGEDLSTHFYYFSHIARVLPVAHAMLNPIIYR